MSTFTRVYSACAWRVLDDGSQTLWLNRLQMRDAQVSAVMDRTYFHSIYFHEPNGVLFEIATDNPGFAADEPLDRLGTSLCLPSWFEPHRAQIEAKLPRLLLPTGQVVGGR